MSYENTISKLLDELIAGYPGGPELDANFDLILMWLANPDSSQAIDFRNEYLSRNISADILRGYVLYILEQKLFSNQNATPNEVLGLTEIGSLEHLKSRYRKLIRIYHPDRGLGDPEVLNQYAERINQAYKSISTDFRQVKKPQIDNLVNSYIHEQTEYTDSFQDNLIKRKIRQKFGQAKYFELKIFAVVTLICSTLIALIYSQSSDNSQDNYYQAKNRPQSQMNENVTIVAKPSDSKVDDKTATSVALIEENRMDKNNKSTVDESEHDSDFKEISYVDDVETQINVRNDKILQDLPDTQAEEAQLTADVLVSVNAAKYKSQGKNYSFMDDAVANNQSEIISIETSELQNEGLGSLLAINDNLIKENQEADVKRYSKSSSNNQDNEAVKQKQIQNSTTAEILDKELVTLLESDIDLVKPDEFSDAGDKSLSLKQAANNKSQKKTRKAKIVKSDASLKSDIETNPRVLQTVNEIQLSETKDLSPVSEQSVNLQGNAPVLEMNVASVSKSDNKYARANFFEKRFAHNFVIKYLESIEEGNIQLMTAYLSNSLLINGVSNNRLGYLNNTKWMIKNSSKRLYKVKFMGDVLRLDEGSFRVTLREHQSVTFKDSKIQQKSSIKTYHIKRYAHGSEIISISDT